MNQDLIDEIKEQERKLSKWEAGFIDSLETEWDDVEELSVRQQEILEEIHERLCG